MQTETTRDDSCYTHNFLWTCTNLVYIISERTSTQFHNSTDDTRHKHWFHTPVNTARLFVTRFGRDTVIGNRRQTFSRSTVIVIHTDFAAGISSCR